MEHKKLLCRFRLRLLGHCLLHCVIWGIAAGAAAVFLCSLVWHILLKAPPPIWLLGSLGAGFLLGFIPCFVARFPTARRTAKKVDETGLQERAGTMLAYSKKDGLLVELQRKDAAEHIQNTKTKNLLLDFPFKALICCMLCVVLSTTMVLLPHDLFAPSSAKTPEEIAREQEIRDMVDGLRQQIRTAELDAAVQKELEAILDQLEQDLLATDNELEQAALISQAQQQIEDTLFNTISRYAIGKALQGYTLTEELGKTLAGDFPFELTEPMNDLREDISGPTKQLTRLSNNLQNALTDSGIDPYDQLYMAIYNFSAMIYELTTMTEGPDATPSWTMQDLIFVFDCAQEAILAALEQQAHDEAEVENLDATIKYDLNSLLGQNDGEVMTSETANGNQNSGGGGNKPSGSGDGTPSGTPSGGLFDSGDSNSGPTTMLEGIYDPVSGSVTYGEVFAAYYAQYLEALDAGEIPEELRPYFEKYFSSLS